MSTDYNLRDDRQRRYRAGRTFDESKRVCVSIDPGYARTYAGQVALLVASNAIPRFARRVGLLPTQETLHPNLNWLGTSLDIVLQEAVLGADPDVELTFEPAEPGDIELHLGKAGTPYSVHGSGWNAYVGPAPSPLSDAHDLNPFGAILAILVAIAELFQTEASPVATFIGNAFDWTDTHAPGVTPMPQLPRNLNIWFIGLGAVGSCVAYFLPLVDRSACATLIDKDKVGQENLDRSLLFANKDIGDPKVDAVTRYLRRAGLPSARALPLWLDEGEARTLWTSRAIGVPDVLISAANERNVRAFVEEYLPPLQIYATTGDLWQCTVLRHIPLIDPCSLCVFPNAVTTRQTSCATARVSNRHTNHEHHVDASLTHLSAMAGLMAMAQLARASLDGFAASPNRIQMNTRNGCRSFAAPAVPREGCSCACRSSEIYRTVLSGGRYYDLSR